MKPCMDCTVYTVQYIQCLEALMYNANVIPKPVKLHLFTRTCMQVNSVFNFSCFFTNFYNSEKLTVYYVFNPLLDIKLTQFPTKHNYFKLSYD